MTEVINNGGSADLATAQWLATYFGVTVTTPTPPTAAPTLRGVVGTPTPAPVRGVTVILGTTEEAAFNNQTGTGN